MPLQLSFESIEAIEGFLDRAKWDAQRQFKAGSWGANDVMWHDADSKESKNVD